ncbi:MAG: hypothetical protein ACI82G_002246, partial [Bradymonadia bacterium]
AQLEDALLPVGSDKNREGWPTHILPVADLKMSRDGNTVVAAAGLGAHLYRLNDRDAHFGQPQVFRGHQLPVGRVAISADGSRAMAADTMGQISIWDTTTLKAAHLLRISKVPTAVQFIWNDMLALAGDNTGRVVCWELEGGRRHLQFQAHHGAITNTAFNGESGVLLTTGGDQTARMWNLELGKQIGSDMCHHGAVYDIDFAYAGRFIVTCGADGHVAIWNSTDGDLIDWFFDSSPVYRVAFDKLNGALVVAGARTIKTLSVDWQRLRELDANARSQAMQITAADHAAMFSQPPAQPAINQQPGTGEAAAVGSVLAARQTSELPLPDRSSLELARGTASSANPWASAGAPAAQAVAPLSPQRATNYDASSFGSLAAAVESTNMGQDPSARSSSYGMLGSAGVSEAESFFNSDDDVTRHSRLETDSFQASGLKPLVDVKRGDSSTSEAANTPPAPPIALGAPAADFIAQASETNSSSASGMSRFDRPSKPAQRASSSHVARPVARALHTRAPAPRALARDLVVGLVAIALLTVGTWFGVRTFTVEFGYPSHLHSQVYELTQNFEAERLAAQTEFEDLRSSQAQQLRRYQLDGITPDQIGRIESRLSGRLEAAEDASVARVYRAEVARNTGLLVLNRQRDEHATKRASIAAAIVALLAALLVGLSALRSEQKVRS